MDSLCKVWEKIARAKRILEREQALAAKQPINYVSGISEFAPYLALLPADTLAHVLFWLPRVEKARARLVCVRWREMLDSQKSRNWWGISEITGDFGNSPDTEPSEDVFDSRAVQQAIDHYTAAGGQDPPHHVADGSFPDARGRPDSRMHPIYHVSLCRFSADEEEEILLGLKSLQWLHKMFVISAKSLRSSIINLANPRYAADNNIAHDGVWIFQLACANGRWVTARWLVRTFRITRKEAMANDGRVFQAACGNGHLALARWLTREFVITAKEVRADENCAFYLACEKGHLETAQWLVREFAISVDEINADDYSVFWASCGCQRTRVAQWLYGYAETEYDAIQHVDDREWQNVSMGAGCIQSPRHVENSRPRKGDGSSVSSQIMVKFSSACEENDLEAARWYADTFADHMIRAFIVCDDSLFGVACEYNNLELAEWMVTRFEITSEEAMINDNHIFRKECSRRNITMILWLISKFDGLAQCLRSEVIYLFGNACEWGDLETAQWFVKTFTMTREEVVGDHNWAFMEACRNDHLNVVSWLTEEFEITDIEAMTNNYAAYHHARNAGHDDVVNYLTKVFGGL